MKVYKLKTYIFLRGVAQLVARVLWEHEVEGSSPFTPTILFSSFFLLDGVSLIKTLVTY